MVNLYETTWEIPMFDHGIPYRLTSYVVSSDDRSDTQCMAEQIVAEKAGITGVN